MSVGIAATYVALVALAAGQATASAPASNPVAQVSTPSSAPVALPVPPLPTSVAQTPVSATSPILPADHRLLSGTVVEVELVSKLSSRDEHIGDKFDLKLAAPIIVDGAVIAPAGTLGKGEVVDVAAAGIAGHPGKLILAARYVEANGLRIPLRGFKLAGEGKDNTGAVMATDIAIGLVSVLIPGGNISFPVGTIALAKVAADVPLPSNANSEPNR